MDFCTRKILLADGNQILKHPFTFNSATIPNLYAVKINGFLLSNLDDYLSYTDESLDTSVIGLLEVVKLELPRVNFNQLSLVRDQAKVYQVQRNIHMKELMS